MGTKVCFVGHHGTTKLKADAILKTSFRTSAKGWLGKGVYFFEANPQLAYNFAVQRFNGAIISIIESTIEVDGECILDITEPTSSGAREFHKHREDFIEAVGVRNVRVRVEKRHLDEVIIDDLCKRRAYILVRSHTYTYTAYDKEGNLSSHIPNGTELCVKNIAIIKRSDFVLLDPAI